MIHAGRFVRMIHACKIGALVIVASVIAAQPAYPVAADSLPSLLQQGISYYIPGDVCKDAAAIVNGKSPQINPSNKNQETNTKIIIGIVKSYKLEKKAALIALMTALQESNITVLGSPSVSNSATSPNLQVMPPVGDHDSVGIFQQRISTGWSTYGNGDTKDVVWQLMDPAYSAQAFLGTPPNAKLPAGLKQPSAIQKGLQNKVPNYLTADPGAAAQEVQGSAFPLAYAKHEPTARALIEKYWDQSPAIPLPIPIDGSAAPSGSTGDTALDCNGGLRADTTGKFNALVFGYAWPDYKGRGWREKMSDYADAIKKAKDRDEYVGDCQGVDCGAFVTRLLRDSGLDTSYNGNEGNVEAQRAWMEAHPQKYEKLQNVRSSSDLRPGDIWIDKASTHTYIFVGIIPGFHSNSASASQCDRAPMAELGGAYAFEQDWFRIKK